MKRNDLIFTVALAFGAVAFFLAGRAPAASAATAYEGEPEIVAATFSSGWCSSCKILKPRLAKIIPAFAGEPVIFVEYDFTWGQRPEIRAQAVEDGLEEVFDRFAGGAGFTLLYDPETQEIVDILTINYSANAMRAAVRQALAATRRGDEELVN
jgi:thiol-disulfide isomerase/thioredoxin